MAFVLGIITARGGSKGIKNKNITPLNDKPLIHYTIEAAQQSGVLDDLVLSTDSQDIINSCSLAGLQCDALRPAHLSTDEAKSSDVLLYEIEQYENDKGKKIDTIILLQPTAPLRTSQDIDQAYNLYTSGDQESLISCYNADFIHPRIMYEEKNGLLTPFMKEGHDIVRRQEMSHVYVRNGAIYIVDRDYFMRTKRTVSESPSLYEMPIKRSINIDTHDDLELAAFYLGAKS